MLSHTIIRALQRVNSKILSNSSLLLKRKALKNALATKAYRDLLEKKEINTQTVSFKNLPLIDKASYIKNYPLTDLLFHPMEEHYTIELSSGYSGEPHYWPRYKGQDDGFLTYMEMGLIFTFQIDKVKTLMLNTFALGTWVTGVKFSRFALELANRESNRMMTVNTGTVFADAINVIKDIGPMFEQIIIAGYPPFINSLIDTIKPISKQEILSKIKIMAGGEAFSENWRVSMNIKLGNAPDDYMKIVSAYGSADTGLEIGYEQPITILLRKMLEEDQEIRSEILGDYSDYTPHFFQYNPLSIFIEEVEGELIFTSDAAIPLVRYNLHDAGGILSFDEMVAILARKYDIKKLLKELKPLKLPCCFVFGRSDGTVSIDGANIYVEEIKQTFDDLAHLQQFAAKKYKNVEQLIKNNIPFKKLADKIFILPNNTSTHWEIIQSYTFHVVENELEFVVYVKDGSSDQEIKSLESSLLRALPLVLYTNCSGYKTVVNENLNSALIRVKLLPESKEPVGGVKKRYIFKYK
jgi:phenylacetate-CoA ligase